MQPLQQTFLKETALRYFLKYVQVNSKANPDSNTHPSSPEQLVLGRIIVEDLKALGIDNAFIDQYGYVYASISGSEGIDANPISFLAHLDTSPSESGENVKPLIHSNYQGESITYPDDSKLILSPDDSPELSKFIGEDIITASGSTLLGADDKAGIAAIMAALELFIKHPDYKHPELRIVFTPDEEIGQGVDNIDITRLGKIAYTIDGGELGELEAECFDAYSAKLFFHGINVHPGSAKNVMVNAAAIAARFYADIPEWQSPEHTEKKEGFFHLTDISGDETEAQLSFIIRDFLQANNEKRLEYLDKLKETYTHRYPGLKIDSEYKHSYQNMYNILKQHSQVVEFAAQAMQDVGINVLRNAIRGGTDGARLCYLGIPTPNIFSGGVMFHSKREWIPVIALQKAAETIICLAELYC